MYPQWFLVIELHDPLAHDYLQSPRAPDLSESLVITSVHFPSKAEIWALAKGFKPEAIFGLILITKHHGMVYFTLEVWLESR